MAAQVGLAAILALLAWLAVHRALRPFGLLVIGRRDIIQALCFGALAVALFAVNIVLWAAYI